MVIIIAWVNNDNFHFELKERFIIITLPLLFTLIIIMITPTLIDIDHHHYCTQVQAERAKRSLHRKGGARPPAGGTCAFRQYGHRHCHPIVIVIVIIVITIDIIIINSIQFIAGPNVSWDDVSRDKMSPNNTGKQLLKWNHFQNSRTAPHVILTLLVRFGQVPWLTWKWVGEPD